jgi:dimethlysulfoniopropionate lyase
MGELQIVLDKLTALADGAGDDLAWFAGEMQGVRPIDVNPRSLPVCALLKDTTNLANTRTRPAVQAICDAAPDLCWQQSYTEADGFSAEYLNAYGWFNLISPEGVFRSDSIRVSVCYWGAGQHYLEHWHEPEEFYLVLAGSAKFHSAGSAPRRCNAGDVIHHASNQAHAIDITPGPLLAAAFWRGNGLLAKSSLKEIT